MLANLLLLPSLLLSLERSIANKQTLLEPALEILTTTDEEVKALTQEEFEDRPKK